MTSPLYEWLADDELTALIGRYYTGEASLWPEICAHVDITLRQRGHVSGAYHFRLLRKEHGYLVRLYEASEYANNHP